MHAKLKQKRTMSYAFIWSDTGSRNRNEKPKHHNHRQPPSSSVMNVKDTKLVNNIMKNCLFERLSKNINKLLLRRYEKKIE